MSEAKNMVAIVEILTTVAELVNYTIKSSTKAGSIAIIGNMHSSLCQTHIFVDLDRRSKTTIVLGEI